MIVPIIRGAVADNPGITYQSIHEIMKPYAKAFTLTDSIIRDGKDLAKNELFGNADDNVKYAKGVKDHQHWDMLSNFVIVIDVDHCNS